MTVLTDTQAARLLERINRPAQHPFCSRCLGATQCDGAPGCTLRFHAGGPAPVGVLYLVGESGAELERVGTVHRLEIEGLL